MTDKCFLFWQENNRKINRHLREPGCSTANEASALFTFAVAENVTPPAVVKCKYMQSEYRNLSNLLGAFLLFQRKIHIEGQL